jgi:hypothetical protein
MYVRTYVRKQFIISTGRIANKNVVFILDIKQVKVQQKNKQNKGKEGKEVQHRIVRSQI